MIAERLKKAVLQAAIQGKLTEQLTEDGNARDLLKQIQKEKSQLIKEGKLKKEKPLQEITEEEIPFDIPENWAWVRLGELCRVISKGTTPQLGKESYGNSGIGFVRAENVGSDGKVQIENIKHVDEVIHETYLHRSILFERDLLVCIAGTLGRAAIVESDQLPLNTNQAVAFVRLVNKDTISVYYLLKTISSFPMQQFLLRQTKVTAIPNLTLEIMRNCLIPLPPLAEQKRIVEKLDQILPEIEKLALDEAKLDALEKAFPRKMKDAILQFAIQGKLTDQLPEDGDARDLLKQIQKEKSQLIKEGKLKKEKPLQEITEEEIPFDIPENWVWVRLGEIGNWAAGATPLRSVNAFYLNGTIPWLKTGDLNDGVISFAPEFITDLAVKKTSIKLQPKGTVLIAMYGATIGKVGILDIEATTNQACCGCIPFTGIYNYYLLYYLQSHKQDFIDQGAGGAQPNISKEKIVSNLIPLPPLAEQQRIVEKLDQILPLCDRLE